MAAPALLALLAALVLPGCGSGGGVGAGASVHVYAAAGLCADARGPLLEANWKAGEVEVRLVCLKPVVDPGAARIDLAQQGRNARRATEDSAAVAFLEEPGKPARFAAPIVAEAGIAFVESGSGRAAMERVLGAVAEAGDSGNVRDEVREGL